MRQAGLLTHGFSFLLSLLLQHLTSVCRTKPPSRFRALLPFAIQCLPPVASLHGHDHSFECRYSCTDLRLFLLSPYTVTSSHRPLTCFPFHQNLVRYSIIHSTDHTISDTCRLFSLQSFILPRFSDLSTQGRQNNGIFTAEISGTALSAKAYSQYFQTRCSWSCPVYSRHLYDLSPAHTAPQCGRILC